jgi:hypothetical protein
VTAKQVAHAQSAAQNHHRKSPHAERINHSTSTRTQPRRPCLASQDAPGSRFAFGGTARWALALNMLFEAMMRVVDRVNPGYTD